jgi:hypothetical protein
LRVAYKTELSYFVAAKRKIKVQKGAKGMQPATQMPKKSRALRARVMQPLVAHGPHPLIRLSNISNLVTLLVASLVIKTNLEDAVVQITRSVQLQKICVPVFAGNVVFSTIR